MTNTNTAATTTATTAVTNTTTTATAATTNFDFVGDYKAMLSAVDNLKHERITIAAYAKEYDAHAIGANKYSAFRGLDKLSNVEPLFSFDRKKAVDEKDPEKVSYSYTCKRLSRVLEESDFTSREAWNAHVAACERVFFALAEWHAALKNDANPSAKLFRAIKQEAEKAAVNLRDSMGANCFVRVNSAVANAFIALCTKQKKAVGVVKTVALRSKVEVRAAVEDIVRAAINGVELSVIVAAKKEELAQYKQVKKAEQAAEKKDAKEKKAKAAKAENKTDKAAGVTAA